MTKTVIYYIDLIPGWQDYETLSPYACHESCIGSYPLTTGARRIRVEVVLPCFGGSADASETVTAKTEEVKDAKNQ